MCVWCKRMWDLAPNHARRSTIIPLEEQNYEIKIYFSCHLWSNCEPWHISPSIPCIAVKFHFNLAWTRSCPQWDLVETDALAHSDNVGLFVSYTRVSDCLAFSVKFSQLRQISHPLEPNTHIPCLWGKGTTLCMVLWKMDIDTEWSSPWSARRGLAKGKCGTEPALKKKKSSGAAQYLDKTQHVISVLMTSPGDRGEFWANGWNSGLCWRENVSGKQVHSETVFSKARQGCLCIMRRVYPEVSLCLRWYHPPLFSFMGYFMRIGISMCTEERCLSHLFSVSSEISFCSLMQNTSELKEKPEMALRVTRWSISAAFPHSNMRVCTLA